jgi:hypothetical protein
MHYGAAGRVLDVVDTKVFLVTGRVVVVVAGARRVVAVVGRTTVGVTRVVVEAIAGATVVSTGKTKMVVGTDVESTTVVNGALGVDDNPLPGERRAGL